MGQLAAVRLLVGSFFRHRHCHDLPSDSSFVCLQESDIARIQAPAPEVDRLSGQSKTTSLGAVLTQLGLHINREVLANHLMSLAIRAKLISISSFQLRLRQFLMGAVASLSRLIFRSWSWLIVVTVCRLFVEAS